MDLKDFLAKGYSGFIEWLPNARVKEKEIIKLIEQVYKTYAYSPLETCAIEKIDYLNNSEEINKQIFAIHRLNNPEAKIKYGLHFDLTVPFARYVANNYANLSFPFKRYQIQKVWRGERKQEGRFQEFYQADIDLIHLDELPPYYEYELIEIIVTIFTKLNLFNFKIKINHRALLEEIYRRLGITENIKKIFIIMDKIDKVTKEEIKQQLKQINLNNSQIEQLISLTEKKLKIKEIKNYLKQQKLEDFAEKINLIQTLDNLNNLDEYIIYDFSIARGLDYYTGLIYECYIEGLENYGSICSGGKYENFGKQFSKQNFSGIGLSIGISRLFYILLKEKKIILSNKQSFTQVIIAIFDEKQRNEANKIANNLREKEIITEVFPFNNKHITKQIQFAEKRNAKFIVLIEQDNQINMKNLENRQQEIFNIEKIIQYLQK